MPDVFVPLDTAKFTHFHRQLMAKNVVIDQLLNYVDHNRKQILRQYKTFNAFQGWLQRARRLHQLVAHGGKGQGART